MRLPGCKLQWVWVLAAACSAPPRGGATMLATTDVFDTSLTLTWTDNAGGEVGLTIERSEVSSASGYVSVGSVGADATRFVDRSVQPRATYWYRVAAEYGDGTRVRSQTIQVTTQAPITVPAAPSGLVARGLSESEIGLTWADNSNNETRFELQRGAASAGPFAPLASPAADAVAHTDVGLTKDTEYWYRLRSANSAGASAWTLPVSSKTYVTNDLAPPTVPGGVSAIAVSPSSIDVTWAASTDEATVVANYRILQNTIEVATVPAAQLGYSANLLGSTAKYCFAVAAVDAVGNRSAASAPDVCATTFAVAATAAAPSQADAGAVSATEIAVTWRDNSNNEIGFRVERATNEGGPYAPQPRPDGGLPATAANTTRYVATGLQPATRYYFRVRSVRDGGFSNAAGCSAETLP